MRRRPRRIVFVLAAILVLLAGAGGGVVAMRSAGGSSTKKTSSGKHTSDPPIAAPVELSVVRRGNISTYLETTTTLEPQNSAMLVARRPGQIVTIRAEEGRFVRRGELLAQIDDTAARLAVEHATLAVEAARREAERGKQMRAKGFLSERELEDVELKLRMATVELKQARRDLSDTRILAPFAGRVVERLVNVGETVVAGKECFRLADFDPVLAHIYFPEREAARVQIGQHAILTLASNPRQIFPAHVTLVNPVVDRSNGTFKVTLAVANPGGTLRPGSFARVQLETAHVGDAVLLPRRGVLSEDGEDYVFVARGDSAVRVPVTIGAVQGDTVQIMRGLAVGDRVVTVGQGGLKQGAKIKPVATRAL
jgi:membrane fusion protein (multidrug efflux system)